MNDDNNNTLASIVFISYAKAWNVYSLGCNNRQKCCSLHLSKTKLILSFFLFVHCTNSFNIIVSCFLWWIVSTLVFAHFNFVPFKFFFFCITGLWICNLQNESLIDWLKSVSSGSLSISGAQNEVIFNNFLLKFCYLGFHFCYWHYFLLII